MEVKRAILVALTGECAGNRVIVNHREFTIGRAVKCSLTVVNLSISRTHCTLRLIGGNWSIIDKSQFGTWLNGKRLERGMPRSLHAGDKIQLGPSGEHVFQFAIEKNPSPLIHVSKKLKTDKRESDLSKHNVATQCSPEDPCNTSMPEELLGNRVSQSEEGGDKVLEEFTDRNSQQSEDCFSQSLFGEGRNIALEKGRNQTKDKLQGESPKKSEFENMEWHLNMSQVEMNLKNQTENLEKLSKATTSNLQDELGSEHKETLLEEQELENNIADEKELAQKRLWEEKERLEKKLKEMEYRLCEKEQAEMEMNQKLKEKDEQRLRDLKQLQEQQKAQTKSLLQEVSTREKAMRAMLTEEIYSLRQEKLKIEERIQGERSKIEGESAENMKRLENELAKVKKVLSNTEGKKQILEKELEETKAKGGVSDSYVKMKQEVLDQFGNLVEMELQCSICSELFVKATTLKCSHTFCRFCITEWKKKKKDCPICRTFISTETRSIVLDNFIDKIVANLSEEMRHNRQAVVEERQVIELLQDEVNSSTSHQTRSGRSNNDIPAINTINLSSDDEDEEEDEEEDDDHWDHFDYSTNEILITSSESSSSYEDFNFCFICDNIGHSPSDCPL